MNLRALLAASSLCLSASADDPTPAEIEQALLRAAKFFREEVGVQGTYLWQYSADLSKREGEGKASKTQGWVQPPGTPSVGMAYLEAWEATTNRYFLDAARETALGLLRGQLQSGGWAHMIELDPELRGKYAYRGEDKKRGRNVTTFDDDSTQSALRFLVRLDNALKLEDEKIHSGIGYALQAVLKAQYPNGAWPQGYDQFPDPSKFPVKKANYPETWAREWPGSQQYWQRYTLNDNSLATMVDTLLEAARRYTGSADETFAQLVIDCHKAAERSGDFLILAQMPEPQPGWAQQYNFDMQPAWARKFEPPAITGGESQGALRTLLDLYRATGNEKFLAPIPKALEWLKKSRLPDGRLARFYELRTNRPLYFTRDYRLTYDDSDMPTHYSFKTSDRSDSIAAEYERLRKLDKAGLQKPESAPKPPSATEVNRILAALDDRGRWVESGRLRYHGAADDTREVIRSSTFAQNISDVSAYLRARLR